MGPDVFRGSPVLDRALGIKIEQRAAAEGFRLVAIRRSGRARLDGGLRWRWARVDCTPGRESVRWGEEAGPDEYLTTVYSEPGTPSAEPVIAVCAHGRHDQCCATRGRLVATLLARREGPAVWECSHIGGDRFAATLLLFPHGINYGRADVLDAGQMVDEYRAGRVMLAGLRGRSAYRFLEQTAQDAARRVFGDLRIEAYEPLSSVPTAPGHWQVLLADSAGPGRPARRAGGRLGWADPGRAGPDRDRPVVQQLRGDRAAGRPDVRRPVRHPAALIRARTGVSPGTSRSRLTSNSRCNAGRG